jgi:hypothetical protein
LLFVQCNPDISIVAREMPKLIELFCNLCAGKFMLRVRQASNTLFLLR